MDNPQDALSAILSNPEALSAALEMAKSFMGTSVQSGAAPTSTPPSDGGGSENAEGGSAPAGAGASAPFPMPVPSGEDDKTKLLLALKPFLSPKRSEKVGTILALMRGMQMMGMAKLFDWGKQ